MMQIVGATCCLLLHCAAGVLLLASLAAVLLYYKRKKRRMAAAAAESVAAAAKSAKEGYQPQPPPSASAGSKGLQDESNPSDIIGARGCVACTRMRYNVSQCVTMQQGTGSEREGLGLQYVRHLRLKRRLRKLHHWRPRVCACLRLCCNT